MSDYVFHDRYSALGIPRPGKDCCDGHCEGTGWVPCREDNPKDRRFDALWRAAEVISPTDDGYHFVVCPDCGGTGMKW